MGEQLIISIGREFGSGGHEIAERISKALGINFYDRNLLDHIANEKKVDADNLKRYDEKHKRLFLTRSVGRHTTSIEQNLSELQFDFIKKKAESGESFVIVGRCSEYVLKDYDGLISIFVLGDKEEKSKRVMKRFAITESEALSKMKRHDNDRKKYHNEHCDVKWGDSRGYDISVNSSCLGVDGTVEVLLDYINRRRNKEN